MNDFNVGDKVTWTHVSLGRNVMSMCLREGTITALAGDVATVQPPSKKTHPVQINTARLRKPGQRSQITEFVEAVCAGNAVEQSASPEPGSAMSEVQNGS